MGAYIQLKQQECFEELKHTSMMSTVISSGKASSLSVAEVLKQFRSDPVRGLTNDEVERRRKLHGLNEFDVVEDIPLWRKYVEQVRVSGPAEVLVCLLFSLHNLISRLWKNCISVSFLWFKCELILIVTVFKLKFEGNESVADNKKRIYLTFTIYYHSPTCINLLRKSEPNRQR